MNKFVRSLVIGLAFSASALTVSASVTSQSTDEHGCSLDGAPVSPSGTYQDGLGLRHGGAFNGVPIVRLASADTSLSSRDAASGDSLGLNRISTRVERLGQGIAATPLVQTLAHPESGQEPQLSMLLLAALGVVTFVARRRRGS